MKTIQLVNYRSKKEDEEAVQYRRQNLKEGKERTMTILIYTCAFRREIDRKINKEINSDIDTEREIVRTEN